MKHREYEKKLAVWEAEGYDVSELRQKWFPAIRAKGRSPIVMWSVIVTAVFVVVAGTGIWMASQSAAPRPAPAPAPVPKSAMVPAPAPKPAPAPAPAPAPPVTFTLNTTANPSRGGSVSPRSGTYKSDTQVTLTAMPSPGYQFDRWSGDASGTNPTVTITMNSNKGVIASFTAIRYSLLVSASPPESGSVSPGSSAFESGSQVTLTATPSSGWKFDHWSGTDNNRANPTSVTMTGDKNVTAYFVVGDTDGDGLSDEEERRIGTNPGSADTDGDGLNDYEEVKVKKTDPLRPDTDGDGVKDGNDLFPLYDAYLKVVITYFESTGTLSDEWGVQEAYFIISVNGEEKRNNAVHLKDGRYLNNPFSAIYNIPDDNQYVSVIIEAWESDTWSSADHYDIGDDSGVNDYETRYDILSGTFTATSDGAADGGLEGLQAKITVEISIVRQ